MARAGAGQRRRARAARDIHAASGRSTRPNHRPCCAEGLPVAQHRPDRGGRSIAVSGVKGRPKEAYFGAIGGGLWKTTDGGATWAPVTDGQMHSSSVGAVAVSESNPDIVYIGMGESCIRGNIMPGDGVYKSTDAGKTWTHVGFDDSDAISQDPHPPDESRHRVRRGLRQATARPATSAASSRAPTAARPGSGSCFGTTRPAPSTSRSIRETRT